MSAHLSSLKVEWDTSINIHQLRRYAAAISRDIHMYCGHFVGRWLKKRKVTCDSKVCTHTHTRLPKEANVQVQGQVKHVKERHENDKK